MSHLLEGIGAASSGINSARKLPSGEEPNLSIAAVKGQQLAKARGPLPRPSTGGQWHGTFIGMNCATAAPSLPQMWEIREVANSAAIALRPQKSFGAAWGIGCAGGCQPGDDGGMQEAAAQQVAQRLKADY